MATQVGSLYTSLTLDSASFVSNMKRAAEVTEQTGATIQKALGVIKVATAAFVGLEIVGALKSAAGQAVEYASALGETSEQLGFTSKGLQELRFAGTQSGASIEAVDKSLGKFTISVGKAREGNKDLREAFDKLGIGTKELANLNTEQLFSKFADGIANTTDKTRAATAEVAILGKGGLSLGVILNSGSAGIKAFADEAERAGSVISDHALKALDDFKDRGDAVKLIFDSHLAQLIGDNVDAIEALGDAAANSISGLGKFIISLRGVHEELSRRGTIDVILNGSGAENLQAGTLAGRTEIDIKAVADAKAALEKAKKAPENPGFFGTRRSVQVANAQAALHKAQSFYDKSVPAQLADVAPLSMFLPNPATKSVVDPIKGSEAAELAAQRKAEEEAKRIAARIQQLKDQIAGVNANIAQGAIALAATPETRIGLEIAAAEEQTRSLIEKARGDDSKNTSPEAKRLVAENIRLLQEEGDQKVAVIRTTYQRQNDEALAQLTDGNTSILLANRSASADLIKDYRDRAEAQAQIVKDQVDFQIAEIQREIDTSTTLTTAQRNALKDKQAAVRAGGDVQIAGIRRNAQGPGQAFLDSLPDTANKISDAIDNIKIDGLNSLNDGLTDAITGTKSLGEAFHDIAGSIIRDLIKIGIQKAIITPLANSLFGGSTGGGIGSFISGLLGSGKANGGPIGAGSLHLVGERGPELFATGTAGTIIPNSALRGANDNRQQVEVIHTFEPSPLLLTSTRIVGSQAGSAAAMATIRSVTRSAIPGGRG